jgi:hypothetical protein
MSRYGERTRIGEAVSGFGKLAAGVVIPSSVEALIVGGGAGGGSGGFGGGNVGGGGGGGGTSLSGIPITLAKP